jgi:predicted transcriptional regulator of viral defense system
MAKSTYISENLNEPQIALIKYLEDHEILYFRLKELAFQLPNNLGDNVNELVENLHQKGLLIRIERGVYAKTNYSDINVLATFISPGGTIAYWSALHYHNLTERFPYTVFVKTIHRKRDTDILGTRVKFVTVKERKQIGTMVQGYGANSFLMTDIEMTLVDCFDQPRYGGEFTDLIKAFANHKLTNQKLIEYTRAYRNTALTKRLGFLADLFHPDSLQGFIQYAKKQVNKKYSLIDGGGPEQGEFVSEWKLRLNIGRENLLQMAQTSY